MVECTFDLNGWSVSACFHDAAEEDGDIGYFAFCEGWGVLGGDVS